jgi:DNA polymerase III gamma/tau subunit
VQEGHDFRHITGQILQHFRDLMLVRSAPEEQAALDVAADRHARLVAQAHKFTLAELSRVLSLLVAAQTDMRWTTSPRLTLELALVRSTIPEADPNPAGLAARIERLERLAGVEGSIRPEETSVRAPGASDDTVRTSGASDDTVRTSGASDTPSLTLGRAVGLPEGSPGATSEPSDISAQAGPTQVDNDLETRPGPHAPDAGALDLQTIRRSWQQLLDRLHERRQMILHANLGSVTAAAYDGKTLELAFPPGRKFAVQKVQSKEEELREVFAEVFGVAPRIQCVAREGVAGLAPIEEEDPPATTEDAVARLKAELGAEVEDGGEAS